MTTLQRKAADDYDVDRLQRIPSLGLAVPEDDITEAPATTRKTMTAREALEKLLTDLKKEGE
jgi:hypothetical protein